MISRRQALQIAALSPLASVSTPVRATEFAMPFDLESLEQIAHSLFGKFPLTLSNQFQIISDLRLLIDTDGRGMGIYIAENGAQVPISVRNIFTNKVALLLEKHDYNPKTISVYKFGSAKVIELSTRINLDGFSNTLRVPHRVFALTETDGQILYSYINVKHSFSCDGC